LKLLNLKFSAIKRAGAFHDLIIASENCLDMFSLAIIKTGMWKYIFVTVALGLLFFGLGSCSLMESEDNPYNPGGALPADWSVQTVLGGTAQSMSEDEEPFLRVDFTPTDHPQSSTSLLYKGGGYHTDMTEFEGQKSGFTFYIRLMSADADALIQYNDCKSWIYSIIEPGDLPIGSWHYIKVEYTYMGYEYGNHEWLVQAYRYWPGNPYNYLDWVPLHDHNDESSIIKYQNLFLTVRNGAMSFDIKKLEVF